MDLTPDQLAKRYASMSYEDLNELLQGGGLTEEAQAIAEVEFQRREPPPPPIPRELPAYLLGDQNSGVGPQEVKGAKKDEFRALCP